MRNSKNWRYLRSLHQRRPALLRFLQAPVHGLAADAQLLGRLRDIAAALLQGLRDGGMRVANVDGPAGEID